MRESVRSLRLYFGLAGSLGAVTCVAGLSLPRAGSAPSSAGQFESLVGLAFSCAALYAAFALPELLRRRVKTVLAILELYRAVLIVKMIVAACTGTSSPIGWIVGFTIVLTLMGYLKKNVKRLAAEGVPSTSGGLPAAAWALISLTVVVIAVFTLQLGVSRYIRHAKASEAREALAWLAPAVARCVAGGGAGGAPRALPATSTPIPRELASVRGTKYQSLPGEWSAEDAFRCTRFSFTGPQYFAYQWQLASPTRGFVVALADLDGDGAADLRFTQAVECASRSSCTVGALVEHSEPLTGGQPAYPGQPLLE
jgi:hypothetical protein